MGCVTIFGENEDELFEKNVINYDSPGNYDDLFKLFRPQPKRLGAYRFGVSVCPSVCLSVRLSVRHTFLYGLELLNGRLQRLGYRLK